MIFPSNRKDIEEISRGNTEQYRQKYKIYAGKEPVIPKKMKRV
jgi:hypothetical protein